MSAPCFARMILDEHVEEFSVSAYKRPAAAARSGAFDHEPLVVNGEIVDAGRDVEIFTVNENDEVVTTKLVSCYCRHCFALALFNAEDIVI